MTIEKTFFCTQCGTRLPKQNVCKHCGFDINAHQPYGNTKALGAAGVGWSEAINHPRLAKYQGHKRLNIFIFSSVLILGITAFLLLSGDLQLDREGLIVIFVITAMFSLIAMSAALSTKHKGVQWIGTIVDKKPARRRSAQSILVIQREDGSTHELPFEKDSIHFDYYRMGDVIKQHNLPHLRSLEKYDKRQDEILFCPSCAYMADARDHYCQACGSPLLKGKQ